jgi:hypothetical protein
MDIKEAVPAIAPCFETSQNDAVRVVTGAQHLAPARERMTKRIFWVNPSSFASSCLRISNSIPQLTRGR